MPEDPLDPEKLVRRLLESGQNIKLGAGVVSKTTVAILVLLVLWIVIVARLSNNWAFDAVLVAVGIIVTCTVIWWTRATHRFAEDNPAQAMLEGAHFLEYTKWDAALKGGSQLSLPIGHGPVPPLIGPPEDG